MEHETNSYKSGISIQLLIQFINNKKVLVQAFYSKTGNSLFNYQSAIESIETKPTDELLAKGFKSRK